jgi:hypothetical protein
MPTLIGEKRQGSITIRPGKNGVLVQEQPFYVTVIADTKYQDRVAIILDTPGMPRFGQIYAGGLAVKSINAERDEDDPLRWHVTITASSEVEEDQETRNESSGSPSSNPIEWIPIANVRFETYDEVLREDFSDPPKKWVNSAKKPFETGLVRQRRIPMVAFSQFEPASTTLETIMDRCDTINVGVYKSKAAKTLLLNVEGATIGTYSGIRCWRVDYTMRYKEDTWTLKQLDVGWGYYESGEFKPFKDAEGNSFLGSLNGFGGKRPNQETDDPAEIPFELYKAINFNTFLKVLFT